MTTLLLIPGLVSDARVWRALAEASPFPVANADVSRDTRIESMAARLLSEHPGELLLAGHSMGGRVAMEMARQAPGRVRGMILANTGHDGRKPGEEPKRLAKIALGHEDMEGLAAEWLPPMLDPARVNDAALVADLTDMVLKMGADVHERQIMALLHRPDAKPGLMQVRCPVLLITGAQDGWSPAPQHHEIAALLPHAEVHVIDGAGHFLPVERPEKMMQVIKGWFDAQFTAGQEDA
ncbi:Pimeloyl-ACP methyl ester carboxylesterase [Pseudooceanicola antarcticus]|uniref:Alpha/beta hydrolase n=1 Tax=Pseudooceanicola antarcticus TaxID=1247613 RepID=A0A285HV81_9RHOB|nr:alpha/beta hydrolase [Pseudooceanicola antarcticus]PJE27453.1 alpha/beta hydrolase [Pseudooceanicola antarcticus]SNY39604.1 Pimeloyl-ACP methyl ester carboxylesterase [Pseudooceanicola antarcticus]